MLNMDLYLHRIFDALDNFENSEFAKALLGENYCNIYSVLRRNEISQITTEIPPIEYKTYLSRL